MFITQKKYVSHAMVLLTVDFLANNNNTFLGRENQGKVTGFYSGATVML